MLQSKNLRAAVLNCTAKRIPCRSLVCRDLARKARFIKITRLQEEGGGVHLCQSPSKILITPQKYVLKRKIPRRAVRHALIDRLDIFVAHCAIQQLLAL